MKPTRILILTGAIVALGYSIGEAQMSLVYSNDFTAGSGSAVLDGTAPTVATGLAGGSSSSLWNNVNQDTAGFLDNGTMGDLSACSVLLDFTPQAGYLYTMTGVVTIPSDMNGTYAGMGFTIQNPQPDTGGLDARMSSQYVGGANWFIIRSEDTQGRAAYEADNWFAGIGSQNQISAPNIVTTGGTYTLTLTLDTRGTQWMADAYVDGTPFSGGPYTYTSNPAIVAAGIASSGNNANVTWQNWSLTAVPEPSTFALAGLGGIGVLLLARRKQKRN